MDDDLINPNERPLVRRSIRESYNIPQDAFVFVTGVKIDPRISIHTLVNCFRQLTESGKLLNSYLIIFGKPNSQLRDEFELAVKHPAIRFVGWIEAKEVHQFLWAADIAIYPGTHSTLWEETVGLGVPCVFRRWRGIEHMELGGNCTFIDDATPATISEVLLHVAAQPAIVRQMQVVAENLGPKVFSYSEIAKRAIAIAPRSG